MKNDDSFPARLSEGDRPRWSTLTAAQRKKAIDRISAFDGWAAGKMNLEDAVDASGLSRSRFYRLAAEWRSAPTLASLGAFTGAGAARAKLDPAAVNALQAVVPEVVRLNAGASVNQLVRLMVQEAAIPTGAKLPGVIRLRNIVENELRRVAATGEAGHALKFDCLAINLPQENGRPFIMFACLDTGTRLILGAAVCREPDGSAGYTASSADALKMVEGPLADLPWTKRLTRIELTAAASMEAGVAMLERLREGGVGANVQLSRTEKRFGRYFRSVVGEKIGRIAITPGRTLEGLAMPDNGDMSPWSLGDARQALTTAVNAHNASILAELKGETQQHPPEDLILALKLLASG